MPSAGDPGVQQGSCPHRKESKALNSRSESLFLMNYFPTYPVQADSCKEHSVPLAEMVNTCYKAAGNLLPNFLAVNFYMVFLILFWAVNWNLIINLYTSYILQFYFSILTETSCRGVMEVVFLILWIKWMATHCVDVVQSQPARFVCFSCSDMYFTLCRLFLNLLYSDILYFYTCLL